MAAISLDNCTVTRIETGTTALDKIVTPATADDGDTIDCSSLYDNEIVFATAQGASDGIGLCAISSSTTLTIPGSTDNEARTIFVRGH